MNYTGSIKTMSKETRKELTKITNQFLKDSIQLFIIYDDHRFINFKFTQKFFNQTFEELGYYLFKKKYI